MIDIGVNINHSLYLDDLTLFQDELKQNDVEGVICIASDLEETAIISDLCKNHSNFWFTAGCHPHQAKTWSENSEIALEQYIPHSVAIGETGLDYNRNYSTPHQQRLAFEAQINLANKHNKPLYLHERDAHDDLVGMLKELKSEGTKGVLHCFTGGVDELKVYLELGLYIGVTGWLLDERRGDELKEAVRYIPDDRLLIETDAPYLVPRNIRPRPKKNHPKYLPYIAQELARIRSVNVETVVHQARINTKALFCID
ncbi:TatD family hydrolase [Marinomonas mediterranea]|jgi:Sec-independent protein translocase TatD (EC 3.1.21.-)|uniref:TatD-related deoxyribonuclease n=1 Tax=Marinomonas mediterranea (strain ATCC 700492 / JCM 21426 / NBRC 103028 / MMB-1) TaxID=717774 RepID=F2K447_MARM1|nr:TatD family hydrolase [Marinomonas mediterranea]ADZ91389.1 TatD-related deoxyribonuclease [Marinomonas mediterranea MMB-1]WCN09362.1 cytoplasmic Dnase [Marinomonas mediterranea]WCN17505.1 cytoplasmic Dnase [Marinomonas mediterranea MMB-1]